MKQLTLSSKIKITGLTIYCNKCKQGSKKWKCAHPDKQVYKLLVHLPGTEHGKRTQVLDTRNQAEAVKMALSQRESMKTITAIISEARPLSIPDYIASFIDYNERPPKNGKVISPDTITDYVLHLSRLMDYFDSKGIRPGSLTTENITDSFAEQAFNSVRAHAGRTQHKYFRTYSAFCNYLIEVKRVIAINPFKGWRFEEEELAIEIIQQHEFESLLQHIDGDHPKFVMDERGKPRHYWFPWLKDAIKLGLYSGARRQEIPIIKWSDVIQNRNTLQLSGGVLMLKDIKNTAIQGSMKIKNKPIEINDDLSDLLQSMDYLSSRGLDRYIIDGDEKFSRRTIKDALSNSFAYYFNFVARPAGSLSFGCLRKTWFTNCYTEVGDHASMMGGHSDTAVTAAHYINKLEAAGAGMKFRRVFKIPTSMTDLQVVGSKNKDVTT